MCKTHSNFNDYKCSSARRQDKSILKFDWICWDWPGVLLRTYCLRTWHCANWPVVRPVLFRLVWSSRGKFFSWKSFAVLLCLWKLFAFLLKTLIKPLPEQERWTYLDQACIALVNNVLNSKCKSFRQQALLILGDFKIINKCSFI